MSAESLEKLRFAMNLGTSSESEEGDLERVVTASLQHAIAVAEEASDGHLCHVGCCAGVVAAIRDELERLGFDWAEI